MYEKNEKLFEELRLLNLPQGEYFVGASGPMGIRNLREINDIDVMVTSKLWSELKKLYPPFYDECNLLKLRLTENIEVMSDVSFNRNKDEDSIDHRVKSAETIEGLPFENIETTLFYKENSNSEKSKRDVELIKGWLAEHKSV